MNESHQSRVNIGGFSTPLAEENPIGRRQFGTGLLGQMRSALRRAAPAPQAPAASQPPTPQPDPRPAIDPQPLALPQPIRPATSALERSRVVFGDELVPGSVVLEPCTGKYCQKGTTHQLGSFHELTIHRLRKDAVMIRAVTVDEDGNQHGLEVLKAEPVRVKFE
jgi:hypothetical protein